MPRSIKDQQLTVSERKELELLRAREIERTLAPFTQELAINLALLMSVTPKDRWTNHHHAAFEQARAKFPALAGLWMAAREE